ncbi:hypothetical protein [Mycolicibacterium fortuitum]|uniref:hypothetical protein n=1 Tax=Mycolicibacterium fortuitum TaxID=1766 RepID=UPI00096DBEE9|nr:hypothetical protein [Mycolicibacterium fortuitum]OMC12530.1 hypothetical protein A5734_00930 [Mycolicibacterium fortuitum]
MRLTHLLRCPACGPFGIRVRRRNQHAADAALVRFFAQLAAEIRAERARRTLAISTVAVATVLTGCSMSGKDSDGNAAPASTTAYNVQLPDKRSVVCVAVVDNGYGIALSCDWRSAK